MEETTRERLTQQWAGYLATEFGGMDYWRLSRKWKELRFRRLAEAIVQDMADYAALPPPQPAEPGPGEETR